MSSVVFYYSFTGSNRVLAEYLAAKLSAEVVAITEAKRRSWWTFVKEVVLKRKPRLLAPVAIAPSWDRALVVTPIWFGRPATPVLAFIEQWGRQLPPYQIVTLCGGAPDTAEQVTAALRPLGRTPSKVWVLKLKDVLPAMDANPVTATPLTAERLTEYFGENLDQIIEAN